MVKILVVEDDEAIRENLCEILMNNGFSVNAASGATQALQSAFADTPDLIVSDIQMEDKDSGFVLLDRLRRDAKTSQIPFLFLSAHHNRQRQGMNKGADDFLVKPFNENDLLEAIRSRLKRIERLTTGKEDSAYIVLHTLDLPIEGQRYNIENYLIVGRNQKCNLRVTDPHVSNVHCVIQPRLDRLSGYWLTDGPIGKVPTPSKYGVYVNGHKIEGHHILKGGERVQISPSIWFEFKVVDPTDHGDPTQSSEG